MVSIENAVIARISKNHNDFEVLVDPIKAMDFKKGKSSNIENILAITEVFKDAKKGERVSEKDLECFFNTTNVFKVAEEIIKKGNIQLTTEQKRKEIEQKRKEIATIISKHGINPKTKLPHPVTRILNAMEQAKVNIDPFIKASDQVESILTKIQGIIPITFARLELAVKIPIQYAGRVSSLIRNMAKIKKEEWKSDSWLALIEIPAGMQSEIYEKLNNLTAGKVEIKIMGKGKS